ncbi:uncharacterized protein METZ01_LOCUS179916, partial [marine metagenome]
WVVIKNKWLAVVNDYLIYYILNLINNIPCCISDREYKLLL